MELFLYVKEKRQSRAHVYANIILYNNLFIHGLIGK